VFSPSNQTHRQDESGVPTLIIHFSANLSPRSSLWRGPPNSDPSAGEAWHPYPAVRPLGRRSLVPPTLIIHFSANLSPRSSLWRGPPNSDPSKGEAWHPYPATRPPDGGNLASHTFRGGPPCSKDRSQGLTSLE
jgi:hypothetical protein